MQRDEARILMYRYVEKESLRSHCLATAAIMKALADRMGGNPERWELIGILHDIDFEMVGGDMNRHGEEGCQILLAHGIDEEIAWAVRRHNYYLCGDSGDPVDVALQAADNISGLITAAAAVKGKNISLVSEKTLRKKFIERAFAAGCRRDKVGGIARFMELSEFLSLALGAMQGIRSELGLE